ncbi:hypothetical protein SCUP234_07919 [Seiridium cupressi]
MMDSLPAQPGAKDLSLPTLLYFFHHVFLPPKLPDGKDRSAKHDDQLLGFIQDCLARFSFTIQEEHQSLVQELRAMVENMRRVRSSHGHLLEDRLREALQTLSVVGSSAALPLEITEQNAGIIIRKVHEHVIFEVFELCPDNRSVMTTHGRLVRQFPSAAVAIALDVVEEPGFKPVIANTLAMMSHQAVPGMRPQVKKARQSHDEDRETTRPHAVTEYMASVLFSLGTQVDERGLCKNTREEVMWSSSKHPWRRSPTWLLVRIALQLTLERTASAPTDLYKQFMVFFLSRILDIACRSSVASDILQTMSAKISRRLLKLESPKAGHWLEAVSQSMTEASRIMKHRWDTIAHKSDPRIDFAMLSHLETEKDLYFRMPELDKFLQSIQCRTTSGRRPSFTPISQIQALSSQDLPSADFSTGKQEYLPFRLAAFESWVDKRLGTWLEDMLHNPTTCDTLAGLIQQYHADAEAYYKGRPEGQSRMLLTILELWIAVDRSATAILPLMKDYQHDIPVEVYQALLLSFSHDMDRLHRAEEYLGQRSMFADQQSCPSIFLSFGEARGFSTRYFSQSRKHQGLLETIEIQAAKDRLAKIEELRRLQDEYHDLMRRHGEAACEYNEGIDRWGMTYSNHSSLCMRCKYESMAKRLAIQVHEWPLPECTAQKQAVVVELDPPVPLQAWRDTTIYFIDNVLGSVPSISQTPRSQYPLREYLGLRCWQAPTNNRRLHLLSETKPHLGTHRKERHISSLENSDVCLNNGLKLLYFDDRRTVFMSRFRTSSKISSGCLVKLPQRSANLEKFILRTYAQPNGEPPNEVLASQHSYPSHMKVGECKALASIPCGYELQWMSILRELTSPHINFNTPETATFLVQICLQTGPVLSGQACRASHSTLRDNRFAKQLIMALRKGLARIEENLESTIYLWVLIFLGTRSLSITTTNKTESLAFLDHARHTAHKWLANLADESSHLKDDEQRMQFRRMLLYTALICSDSFNIDQVQLGHVLNEPETASIFIEASIIIRDNIQLKDGEDRLQSLLLDRWYHLMHRASPTLRSQVLIYKNKCLDLAISRYWSAFDTSSDWRACSTAEYWLENISGSPQIHYNTLTGELLVNGSPLSRLPPGFVKHKTYSRLFGQFLMNVMPSSVPGMEFSSKTTFGDCMVHFSIESIPDCSSDLLVYATNMRSSYDIIPPRALTGLIPKAFVHDFVHWYHHDTGEVEFRPLADPWQTSSDDWRLVSRESGWIITRNRNDYIVNPLSDTGIRVSKAVGALDTCLHQHILYSPVQRRLDILLPRLRMNFFVRDMSNAVESCQFRGMQIDEQQSIGTLVGLRGKLVLRDSNNPGSRVVLIPEGQITYRKDHNENAESMHIQVFVTTGTATRVQHYLIDSRIGRLVDAGTLQSKLFLAYLHGLTSYCIPDPLTNRTGTEQALTILKSSAVKSSVRLSQEEGDLLARIAGLAPRRHFYPRNEKVMQTVIWCPQLSYISQHGLFYTVAKDILENMRQISFLYPHQPLPTLDIDHADAELVARDLISTAYLRMDDFGAELFSAKKDVPYKARDRTHRSGRAQRTVQMAVRARESDVSLQDTPSSDLVDRIYSLLSEAQTFPARNKRPKLCDMQYSAKWLTNPQSALPDLWHNIHYAFQCDQRWINKFEVIVWLAAQAFASDDLNQVIQVLFSLAFLPRVAQVQLPAAENYNLSQGYRFKDSEIRSIIAGEARPLWACPEADLQRFTRESSRNFHRRQNQEYQNNKDKGISTFLRELKNQWPCPRPRQPTLTSYINGGKAMSAVLNRWQIWHKNSLFKQYLERMVEALHTYDVRPSPPVRMQSPSQMTPISRKAGFISIDDLFQQNNLSHVSTQRVGLDVRFQALPEEQHSCERLYGVLNHISEQATSEYEQRYRVELKQSLSDLQAQDPRYRVCESESDMRDMLQQHQSRCNSCVKQLFNALMSDTDLTRSASQPSGLQGLDAGAKPIAAQMDFLPRRSVTFFLSQLQRSRWNKLSEPWRKKLVAYGVALTQLQRADRLLQYCGNEVDFLKELRNHGHENWDPFEYPEWLLMECESGFLIRRVQQQIAWQMMAPPDGKNATMQLNMGEGKSSVIVPSIAMALATGVRLVRTIVTKPQFRQMHQILLAKCGNLIARRIYQLPISREILLDSSKVQIIRQMLEECMKGGGILLVQPEHLLSFQLMGIERMISGEHTVARMVLMVQEFLDAHSRDIIDESDENLSVKFELVYTIGQQRSIEHSPQRWTIIQQVLELVRHLAPDVQSLFPQSLEIYEWRHTSGRFPRLRIFREDALRRLLERLAEQICHRGLEGFPIARQPEMMRTTVQRYILHSDLPLVDIEMVEKGSFWTDAVIDTLLLLRGLIAGGIIAHALCQKRWRVNYGVDSNRIPKTRLAVPFRAKDDPAPRSEFSHPDVVIVLTSLSYYYAGLKDQDLFDLFSLLKNDDQATSEYSTWVHYAPTLPKSYGDLAGINLQDRVQCKTEVFPHLRYSKGAIDYFISHLVFSKEMQEFPYKLSASGWDLGKVRSHPVTGFSGTNDSRYILPATVSQLDIPEQRHTNALVLNYLVKPENKVFLMSERTTSDGAISDGVEILGRFTELMPQVRVILDVGAQIIDLTNQEVARRWLRMVEEDGDRTQAVIYFDNDDVLSVIDRFGCIEPLQVSPFAKQTDKCLVFLDESHTRGTDLKLPEDYRAAVTLGHNLTKDRLVQACMRMRKLGQGQTVVFCIPDEIKNKIMQQHCLSNASHITATHVLAWAIRETYFDTKKSVPLWATQASRFYKQDSYRQERIRNQGDYSSDWAERFLESEAQTLEHRYRPGCSNLDIANLIEGIDDQISKNITDHLEQFGPLNIGMASLQEEQERELSPEAEEERQVQRPPRTEPLVHQIHPNLRYFIRHGYVIMQNGGFMHAFESLGDTSAAVHADVNEFPRDLLVTEDFARTVEMKQGRNDQSDLFQRPVQWVLTSGLGTGCVAHLVVVSPFEAQELLVDIKASETVTLHIYTPRMNVNHPSLDHLMLYTVPERESAHSIPQSLVRQLNLFAGQLYVQSFKEYTEVCDTLCLAWVTIDSDIPLEADGFIPPGCSAGMCVNNGRYTRSPTKFVQVLMAKIRRNNEGIDKTHVGKILNGLLLKADDFSTDS